MRALLSSCAQPAAVPQDIVAVSPCKAVLEILIPCSCNTVIPDRFALDFFQIIFWVPLYKCKYMYLTVVSNCKVHKIQN